MPEKTSQKGKPAKSTLRQLVSGVLFAVKPTVMLSAAKHLKQQIFRSAQDDTSGLHTASVISYTRALMRKARKPFTVSRETVTVMPGLGLEHPDRSPLFSGFRLRGRNDNGKWSPVTVRKTVNGKLKTVGVILILAFSLTVGLLSFTKPVQTNAAAANTINFQSRLETLNGGIVADGTYNVEFNLYNVSSGGSSLWTEDRLNSASQGVTVKNGYLTANLGSITALPSNIWGQQLWLGMTVRGTASCTWASCSPTDAEMSPRLSMTAVPAAYSLVNTNGSFSSTLAIQGPTGGNQTFVLQDQTSAGTYNICIQNSAACGFAPVSGTLAGSYIQNQNTSQQASSNFWISGTGRADTALQAPSFDSASGALSIGTGNASAVTIGKSNTNVQVAGTLSVGTSQSFGAITLTNGAWLTALDSSGSAAVNVLSVNSNNEIQLGAALNVDGGIVLPTDAGQVTLVDLPIDGSATAGTPESYSLRVGTTNVLTVYGEADGSGNLQNGRVAIGTSISPQYTLDVGGTLGVSGLATLSSGATLGSTLTLQNGATITNSTTDQLNLSSNSRTLSVNFADASGYVVVSPSTAVLRVGAPLQVIGSVSARSGGGDSISINQNGTTNGAITNTNGYINLTSATGLVAVRGIASQSADLFQLQDSTGTTVYDKFDKTGNLTVGTAGGGQTITLVGGATGTRPASPTAGQLYFDTTTNQLLQYNGTKWVSAPRSSTLVVAAGNATQAAKDAADYVGDGTNDQNAINSAISALPASGGQVVLLEGTFNLTGTVTMNKANVNLVGQGNSTILKRMYDETAANTGGVITISVAFDTVSQLQINGNKATYSSGNDYGIFVDATTSAANNNKIVNNLVKNTGGIGIFLRGDPTQKNNGQYISGNTVTAAGSTGIYQSYPGGLVGGYVVTGNTTYSNAGDGIGDDKNGSNISVVNNSSYSNTGDGFSVGSTTSSITGNTSEGNGGNGFNGIASNQTITGNTASSNTGAGFVLIHGTNNTITGNISNSNGAQGIVGSYPAVQSAYDVISGNAINSNAADGISLNSSYGQSLITGNTITNNGGSGSSSGITLSNGNGPPNGMQITNNNITDNAGSGFAINIKSTSTSTYLSGNVYSGTGATSINDSGTGTIYANQVDSNGNLIIKSQGGGLAVGQSSAAASFALQGGMRVTALPTPAAPTVTPNTTGSTTYGYKVTALDGNGETLPSPETTIANGNATANNTVSWTPIGGAYQYRVYRTTGGATQGLLATVNGNLTSYTDNNGAASGSVPTQNLTGGAYIQGNTGIGTLPSTNIKLSVAAGGNDTAIYGNASGGIGVTGITTSGIAGVQGSSFTSGYGVYGSSSSGIGVAGISTSGYGLYAASSSQSSAYFQTSNTSGTNTKATLLLQDNTSQTADLLQAQDSTGTKVLTSISASGQLRVGATYTSITVPSSLASSPIAGGSLTAGAYKYEVTAIDSVGGETTVSNEVTGTTAGGNLTNSLTWTAVTGASGYKVYRTASGGASGSEVYLTTVLTNSFKDTGSTTAGSATPPASNTAYVSTNVAMSNVQLTVGGNGTPTGQVYVGGTVPSGAVGSVATGSAPYDVYVEGRYAYVTNRSANTLQIIDITNPSSPSVVGTGSTGSSPQGVYVQGRYAYVVNSNGGTLQIFDISNPASPTSISSVKTGSRFNPEAIYVQGRYAYIYNQGNGPSTTVQLFDISNPASPVAVGNVTIAGSQGTAPGILYVQGRYAYLGNTNSNNLKILDVSDPASITVVATIATSGVGPQGVYVQGRYAYVVTQGAKLEVYDISTPSAPVRVGLVSTGASSSPISVYVQGRYAYVANSGTNALGVYDISNPTNPFSVGSVATDTAPNAVYVQGRYAYVANKTSNTLQIFDLGGTYTQQLEAGGAEVGTLQVDSNAQVTGDTNVQGGLTIGQSIQAAGNIGVGGNAFVQGALTVAGGIQGGLTVNGLSTPNAPVITSIGANTDAATWSYQVVAVSASGGNTPASATGSISASDNASLSGANFNVISWTPVAGAVSYKVYRTAVGTSPSSTGLIATTSATSLQDNGLAGDGSTPPSTDTSGGLTVKAAGNSPVLSVLDGASAALQLRTGGVSSLSVYLGRNSGVNDNESAYFNVGIGDQALQSMSSGGYNIGIGTNALNANTSGTDNTAVGSNALTSALGSSNTALGSGAGSLLGATGDSNLLLGYNAGANLTSGSNNIIIGANINAPSATGSNQLQVGNILQGNMTGSAMTLGITALTTIQPAANMTNGQIGVTQTATFANATASGTVIGYQQNITVSSSTAATNKGFDINITDNSTTTGHTDIGLKVTMSGSNTLQGQVGADISVNTGLGLRVASSGRAGSSLTCANSSGGIGYAICADNTSTSLAGAAIYARAAGSVGGSSTVGDSTGTGVAIYGINTNSGGSNTAMYGLQGVTRANANAVYSSVGVFGQAAGGTGSLVYGGYFTLDSTSTATSGAALYATTPTYAVASSGNGLNAVTVLQAAGGAGQSVSATTGVTAGNGAGISLVAGNGGAATGASGVNTSGTGGAVLIMAGSGGNITSGNGGSGANVNITAGNGANGTGTSVNGNGGNVVLTAGFGGSGGSGGGGSAGIINLNSNTSVASGKSLTVTAGNVAFTKGSDYSTTGSTDANFGVGALFRLTGATAQTLTGIQGGTNGRMITIINAAGQAATLCDSSDACSTGTAVDKIVTGTGSNLTVAAGASVSLVYDSGSSVWRATGISAVGGAGGVTLANVDSAGSANATGMTLTGSVLNLNSADGTHPGAVNAGTQTFGGNKTFLGTITMNPSVTATAFVIQNAGNSALVFDNSSNILKVYDPSNSGVYASITASSTGATFAASSGTTTIGSGSGSGGNINLLTTNLTDVITAYHQVPNTSAGSLAAAYNDFSFQRQVNDSGTNSYGLQGNVFDIEDTSTLGSSTTVATNILYLNQNNTGMAVPSSSNNLILAQTGGNTTRFQVDTAGNVTAATSFVGSGSLLVDSASGTQLNLGTGANAHNTVIGSTTGSSALTLQSGSGNVNINAATVIGSGTLSIDSASGTALNIGTGANAHTVTLGNTTGASSTVIQAGSGNILLNTSAGNKIIVGSATTDTTLVLFQPDSYSTYDDSGVTCTPTANQGAFYYNTTSGSIRACRGSGWEDVVTTAALGLQLFGVVPDSGTNPGDLAGITSGGGPCEVIWTAVDAVSVNSCVAYSGGRKVIVQSTSFTSMTGTAGQFRHICLNGTDNQPALSAAGTETANLPTFNLTQPILCLADIKFGGTNTMAAGGLYDLRTFTTTNKTFTTINSNAVPGMVFSNSATPGVVTLPTGTNKQLLGVIVASTGSASTTTINAIYAYSGPANVKASGGSVNGQMQSAGSTGYVTTATGTAVYATLGIAQNTESSTCTSAATCQTSIYTVVQPR